VIESGWRFSFSNPLDALQRQFHRLVEMLQLLNLDPLDAKAFKAFRIQVKERLYRFNYVSVLLFLRYVS
jgi:histone acetyltransferase 1